MRLIKDIKCYFGYHNWEISYENPDETHQALELFNKIQNSLLYGSYQDKYQRTRCCKNCYKKQVQRRSFARTITDNFRYWEDTELNQSEIRDKKLKDLLS